MRSKVMIRSATSLACASILAGWHAPVTASMSADIAAAPPEVPDASAPLAPVLAGGPGPASAALSQTSYSVSVSGGLGREGSVPATFTVALSAPQDVPVSVIYDAAAPPRLDRACPAEYPSWCAEPGKDYLPVTGSLVFVPGDTSKSFVVPILDDNEPERRIEGFPVLVRLADEAGTTVLDPPYEAGGIEDDDYTLAHVDFNGNAATDYSVFRPSTGTWFVQNGLTLNYGTEDDIPVPGHYDGDRNADVAVFRPSNGVWFLRNSTGGETALAYGTSGDVPVPADYDGDKKTDVAVFRPSNGVWFIRYSTGGQAAFGYGTSGDVAVPADYDGDERADIAVFRSGTWFIRPTRLGSTEMALNYGTAADIPVVADYDGDTIADIAVFRPATGAWFVRHSSDGAEDAFHFGTSGDVPVPGDYDGDAIADRAVFRPSVGVWFVETGATTPWGEATDIPLPSPAAVRMAYFASPA